MSDEVEHQAVIKRLVDSDGRVFEVQHFPHAIQPPWIETDGNPLSPDFEELEYLNDMITVVEQLRFLLKLDGDQIAPGTVWERFKEEFPDTAEMDIDRRLASLEAFQIVFEEMDNLRLYLEQAREDPDDPPELTA